MDDEYIALIVAMFMALTLLVVSMMSGGDPVEALVVWFIMIIAVIVAGIILKKLKI